MMLTRAWEVSLWLLRKIGIKPEYVEYLEPDITVESLMWKNIFVFYTFLGILKKYFFIFLSISFLRSLVLDS